MSLRWNWRKKYLNNKILYNINSVFKSLENLITNIFYENKRIGVEFYLNLSFDILLNKKWDIIGRLDFMPRIKRFWLFEKIISQMIRYIFEIYYMVAR